LWRARDGTSAKNFLAQPTQSEFYVGCEPLEEEERPPVKVQLKTETDSQGATTVKIVPVR